MFEIGDRMRIHDYPNEWGGSGFVAGILENGALVSVNHGVHKGIYYVYFDELEKMD